MSRLNNRYITHLQHQKPIPTDSDALEPIPTQTSRLVGCPRPSATRVTKKRGLVMKKLLWTACLTTGCLATSGFVAGCAIDDGSDADFTSADEQELYAKGTKIWQQLSIPVCWENPATTNDTQRGWVKSAVHSSWESVSYVRFTGWGTCTSTSKGVRIKINDEGPHTTGLGRALNGASNGMVLNFTFNNWSQDCATDTKFCIEAIAVHEFGHALGFAHEQNRPDKPATCKDAPQGEDGDTLVGPWDSNSVMNYCAPNWNNNGALSSGDIKGVRQYYGSPTFAANRKAALLWPNGKIFFFNGSQYTRYDVAADRADSGYPGSISAAWHNWPATWSDGIDAGVVWNNGKAYMFRGSQYLRYDIATDRVDPGYPLPIAGHWGNWPATWTSVDASVSWPNGKVYFFRGAEYLRYDMASDRVDPGYPLPIAGHWPGLMGQLDYGLVHPNGKAYFFRGTQYQRYDITSDAVDETLPIVGHWPGVPF